MLKNWLVENFFFFLFFGQYSLHSLCKGKENLNLPKILLVGMLYAYVDVETFLDDSIFFTVMVESIHVIFEIFLWSFFF